LHGNYKVIISVCQLKTDYLNSLIAYACKLKKYFCWSK